MKSIKNSGFVLLMAGLSLSWSVTKAFADENDTRNILKQGLLGAGTGAIASSASGGKAGKGALIGAGTNIIGGALLDTLMGGGSQPRQQQQVTYVQEPQYAQQQAPQYVQQAPQVSQPYPPQQGAMESQPVYVQQVPVYQQPPQEDPTKKILKQGLLGAGTGAIAAGASGGSAGKGALIGAGTNVIGGALLDTLMGGPSQSQPQPQQPQQVYYQQAPPPQAQPYPPQQYSNQNQPSSQGNANSQLKKKIIRKYDSDGHVVSEEEVWE